MYIYIERDVGIYMYIHRHTYRYIYKYINMYMHVYNVHISSRGWDCKYFGELKFHVVALLW